MKKIVLATIAACLAAVLLQAAELPKLYFNPPPRITELSKETTTLIADGKSDLEIVAPAEAGEVAKFAGEELQTFLQQATGAKIPLVDKRSGAKYAIILGDNALACRDRLFAIWLRRLAK